MDWPRVKKIHFVGIGGIGISAVAAIMVELGKSVSGSDLQRSGVTDNLAHLGATIFIGEHQASHVPDDADLVVYSNAVPLTNPEVKRAQSRHLPILSYPQLLGSIMEPYRALIASGTHGKSTITSMLANIFIAADLDPSVVVGTKVPECNKANYRVGLGKYFIAEGDEYKGAFLHYTPLGLIISNIEADHLDFYKTERNVVKAFASLVKKMPNNGIVVANADDPNVNRVIASATCHVLTFGLVRGDYIATHIRRHGELTRFTVRGPERFDIALKVPGVHNIKNALAAAILAMSFGIPIATIQSALLNYSGVWRRFEIVTQKNGITVVDDYAHHPTEIKATLAAARSAFPTRRIWCIFQPHSADRTKQLFDQFVNAFSDSDQLIITEIYHVAGRDKKSSFSAKKLWEAIRKQKKATTFVKDFRTIPSLYGNQFKSGDVIITMGAGSITEIAQQLV